MPPTLGIGGIVPAMPNRRQLPLGSAPRRAGFTLIEVVVALLVLQIALLALAASGALSLRRATAAAARSLAARAVARRMELVRAAPCAAASGSAALARGVRESWKVTLVVPGLVAVRDSASWPDADGTRALVVGERVPCRVP